MAAIDVGSAATDRAASRSMSEDIWGNFHTIITYVNPANGTGLITSVETWLATAQAGNSISAGSFVDNGSANFTCHDGEVLGELATGSKQTISGLTIAISSGEYLGLESTLAKDVAIAETTGGDDDFYWSSSPNDIHCVADSTATLAKVDATVSLYGIGTTGTVHEGAVTEALTTSEALVRTITAGRSVSENLTSGELLATQWALGTTKVEGLTTAEALARTVESTKALAEAFAAGEAYKDTSVPWYNANWAHRIDLTVDHDLVGITQKLASNAASGQKDVVVQNGAAYAADDSIVIKDSENRETGTVASVASNTVTLVDNLAAAYTTANGAFLKNVTDSTNLTDFPCLFNEHDLPAHFWENVKADGTDVVLTTSDGTTKMKRELVAGSWSRANHKAEIHGKAPTASTTVDTLVWLYYGYAAGAETNDEDTWDEWFEAVYHMNDDPDTSHIKDSTANNNDGTKKGANEPNQVAGTIGYAQDFGGDDKITIGDMVTFSAYSLLVVSKHNDVASGTRQLDLTIRKNNHVYMQNDGASAYQFRHYNGSTEAILSTAVANGAWNCWDGDWDGTNLILYKDGVSVDTDTISGMYSHTEANFIGYWSRYGDPFILDGLVCEVRISSTNREPSHISTTNNTLMSPATFYSVGSVQHYAGLAAIVSFYTSILSENLTQAEALGVQASYQVSKAEALTTAETLARTVESTKAIAEAMTTSEALARMVSSGRVLTEGLTANEALARTVTSTRVIAEALSIADTNVANLALYLLTLQLLARALTMQKPATSLTVKLHDRDYTATMEA